MYDILCRNKIGELGYPVDPNLCKERLQIRMYRVICLAMPVSCVCSRCCSLCNRAGKLLLWHRTNMFSLSSMAVVQIKEVFENYCDMICFSQ